MTSSALAIAIEDRVNLWYDSGKEISKLAPRSISEGGDYFANFHQLIKALLDELIKQRPKVAAAALFDSIASTVVSVPGVIQDHKVLLQMPVWHSLPRPTVQWRLNGADKEYFDFPEELAEIAASLIANRGESWPGAARERFKRTVFVVNDTTVCAAFEYGRRTSSKKDFIYLKLHNGVNCGVVRRRDKGDFELLPNDAEAGHGFGLPHELDCKTEFYGVCAYHRGCFEGMLAGHSMYRRAMLAGDPVFGAWKRQAGELERRGLHGQALDNELVNHVLGQAVRAPMGNGEGVVLVAHYAAQLVYQLAIGPLAPDQFVVGGRMAKKAVIAAIRANVVLWANGYPQRPQLSIKGIDEFIIASTAVPGGQQDEIEVEGAMTIAHSLASLPRANSARDSAKVLSFGSRKSIG